MTRMKYALLATALLPTLVLSGLAIIKAMDRARPALVRLPITGYDPRDLLYGHYLRFRFNFNGYAITPDCQFGTFDNETARTCTICITPATQHGMVVKNPPSDKECPVGLPFAEFSGSRKYFVPESDAQALDRLLRQDGLTMSIDIHATDGRVTYGALFVNDMPWQDYLALNPAAP